MTDATVPVTIVVLDKEYMVSCPPEEKESLLESARELNERMRQLRDDGKVLGSERMAVMTALNVLHELAELKRERVEALETVESDIRRLTDKVHAAVGRRQPHETLNS